MILSPVAKVYAEALLAIGREGGRLPVLVDGLRAVVGILREQRGFQVFLESPAVPREEKRRILEVAFGGRVDPVLVNLLKVLVDRGRQDIVGEISEALVERADEVAGRVEAEVVGAVPLETAAEGRIKAALDRGTGLDTRLRTRVAPEILGGLILQVGDLRVDGSVRHSLARLRGRLRSRPIRVEDFVNGEA